MPQKQTVANSTPSSNPDDGGPAPGEPVSEGTAGTRLRHWWRDKRWHAGTLVYTTGGLFMLFFWLLGGDFGYQLKERAIPPALQLLLRQFEASDFLAGLFIVTAPQIFAVIANPFFGYISDRHRGRWGRRIPFLLIPTPIAVISMVGLAFGPAIGRGLHEALGAWSPGQNESVIIVLGAFWAAFEFASIICNALLVALVTDVVPQEVVGRFFALFRVVAVGAGMVFNYFILGQVEEYYVPIFLFIALVYGVSFGAMCLKVKEGSYPPPPPVAVTRHRWTAHVVDYARDCLSNSYYLWIFASAALVFAAMAPLNLYSIYFAKSLNMSMGTLGKYGTLMLFLALVIAYPTGWLVDRFHSLRVTIVATVMMVAATSLAFVLVNSPASFGIAYVVCGVMAAFWVTAWWPLSTLLFPKAKFGAFYSVQLAANAISQALIAPACGWTLDQLNHEYRYMYLWAAVLAALALGAYLVVYRRFKAYGGLKSYVPPV